MRWLRWHCPPDTGFEIRSLAVWGRARYLSVTEAPHNTDFHTWMGKKHFCFFETAETGNRTPNSGVKGSGANHYPRAPALHIKYSSPSRKLRQRLRAEYFFWCNIFMNFIFFHYVIHILLLRCHDIETNPGPNNPTELSIYCLNIRSLLAVVTEKPRVQKIDHLIAERRQTTIALF